MFHLGTDLHIKTWGESNNVQRIQQVEKTPLPTAACRTLSFRNQMKHPSDGHYSFHSISRANHDIKLVINMNQQLATFSNNKTPLHPPTWHLFRDNLSQKMDVVTAKPAPKTLLRPA
jgi:hypothetical protein